ncbi:MAG: phosphate ABC transporter ATP-binding protein [Thermoplasmata archaeon]|nr:MAG: phosphate ABC transporter ATP-binding protein [Thermoplasmata archaeon]
MEFEIEKVTKQFEDKCALSDVTIKGEKGRIIAVIGPSGAGKTTLLRLINLLDVPTKGTIRIQGEDTDTLTNGERYNIRMRMAMVFQNPSLFQRTVESNVAFGLKIRNHLPDRIAKEVLRALRLVGLQGFEHQFAPTLSAGEAQRVSFARAIVFEPELLLLDEFTANLDPANVKLLEEAVIKYHQNTNATVVLATHNLFQAKRLANEVVFIFDGKIVERAEKEEFFENPQNPLTESFLSGELIY